MVVEIGAGNVILTSEQGDAISRVGLDFKLWVTDVGYGAFGVLIAALWSVLGPFTPVLVLIPVLVARWAVKQFAAQQQNQGEVNQQDPAALPIQFEKRCTHSHR